MPFNFVVKALIAFYKFHFLFFGMVGGADSIDIHVVSFLRSSAFLVFDSKCFIESTVVVLVEEVLFLPFAIQPNGSFGPSIEGPRGSKWIIGIGIYDCIKESFL
jgi:hypothetical protein